MLTPVRVQLATVADLAPVHAIVPLALLEAVRNLDTPLDDGLAGLDTESVARRLGMSTTVAAQIERYREAARRHARVPGEEAVQVFRLVGRRPDATLVYSDAGRRAARLAVGRSRASRLARLQPRALRRRLGERRAIRVAGRLFGIEVGRRGDGLGLRLTESLATSAGSAGPGCYFYSALLGELLRVTSGFEGAMVHDRCLGRGDEACTWRAAEADRW
jgi:hypothetical protein